MVCRANRPRSLVSWTLGLSLALGSAACAAAELNDKARREVSDILERIEKSGCDFNRSGSWYDGASARKHLQRKYDYLLARDKLGSAEDFISLAATRSSMSGEAYAIRCGSTTPVPSAQWLEAELRRIRAASPLPPR